MSTAIYEQITLLIPERPSPTTLAALNSNTEGITRRLPLDRFVPSRFQTRDADDEEIAALAADIELNGLIHPPIGRIDPNTPDRSRIELAVGHRRLAAHVLLHQRFCEAHPGTDGKSPWGEMNVELRELSDLQMFRYCISENANHRPLTMLEKAAALHRAINEFGLTQAQAGAEFGLTQSSVSHLLSILSLPAAAHAVIATGDVPERHARAVVGLSTAAPTIALSILERVAAAADKESAYAEALDDALNSAQSEFLHNAKFNLDTPITVDPTLDCTELQQIGWVGFDSSLRACSGCPALYKHHGQNYCLRPACYDLKNTSVELARLRATAATLGLPLVLDPNGYTCLEDLAQTWLYDNWVKSLLAAKPAGLFIGPMREKSIHSYDSYVAHRLHILGNHTAALYTNDPEDLLAICNPLNPDKPSASANTHPTGGTSAPASGGQLSSSTEEENEEDIEEIEENDPEEEARYNQMLADQAKARAEREKTASANTELERLAAAVFAEKCLSTPPALAGMLLGLFYDVDLDVVIEEAGPMAEEDDRELFKYVEAQAPAVKAKILARGILQSEIMRRLESNAKDGAYIRYPYCETAVVAYQLAAILGELEVHIPAQILIAAGLQRPAPKPAKAKAKKSKSASAKASHKPAPKPAKSKRK